MLFSFIFDRMKSVHMYMNNYLNSLLELMIKKKATDLHIKCNSPPLLRYLGELISVDTFQPLSKSEVEKLVDSVLSEEQKKKLRENLELDLCLYVENLGRFRTHVFFQRGTVSMVLRSIPYKIPTLEEIGLSDVVKELALRPRGLILVTGPSGAGKSTTQAAIIDFINTNAFLHIVTIEDPIEFVHQDKNSLINQRQLGRDTKSFAEALKHVFRQDPDVILVGEMRDLETIQMATIAAETGHLVIATLHTPNAIQTVDRIIDVFPPHQQQQMRIQLASNIIGIISQVLVRRKDGSGCVAAFEILVATPAIRNLIREARTYQIEAFLQAGGREGMITLNRSLANLYKQGIITYAEGLSKATNVKEYQSIAGAPPSDLSDFQRLKV